MVNISVVIVLFNDDGFVAIPMITVADDVAVTVPVAVTVSVTLTNGYASGANTNPDLFRSSRYCGANSSYGGDNYGILNHCVLLIVVKLWEGNASTPRSFRLSRPRDMLPRE
jgi:hypothetical protein